MLPRTLRILFMGPSQTSSCPLCIAPQRAIGGVQPKGLTEGAPFNRIERIAGVTGPRGSAFARDEPVTLPGDRFDGGWMKRQLFTSRPVFSIVKDRQFSWAFNLRFPGRIGVGLRRWMPSPETRASINNVTNMTQQLQHVAFESLAGFRCLQHTLHNNINNR